MAVSAAEIVEKAIELGYDKCGIIPVEMMRGYEAKLEERMEHFPETRRKYEGFRKFAYPEKEFPWAKAIVIVSFWYGKYRISAAVRGHIAKYYLTDGRRNPDSQGYKAGAALEKYLRDSGLHVAFNRDFALTALRWAAMQAGIGIVRKNNFFYTEKGSYQYLEAFLIDEPLQLTAESTLRPCAESCDLCIRACPAHSLEAPYTMNRNTYVSCLTTWDAWDMRTEPRRGEIGPWIFGCDVCQDACPHNTNAWKDTEKFPGLEAWAGQSALEEIVLADYDWLRSAVQPKLWYIPKGKEWRYKTNALNAMRNSGDLRYLPVIRKACGDESPEVREMAQWVLDEIEKSSGTSEQRKTGA